MKNEKGFTLIEFLIYTVLFSLVFGILITLSVSTLKTRLLLNTDLFVQRNIDVAFHALVDRVENANSIQQPVSGIGNILEVTGDDPAIYTAIFTVSDGKLYLSQGGEPAVQITSDDVNVSLFTVERMEDPLDGVQIKMSVETRDQAQALTTTAETLQTTVMLRY